MSDERPLYFVKGVGSTVWHPIMPRKPGAYTVETACGIAQEALTGYTATKLAPYDVMCSVCESELATTVRAGDVFATMRGNHGK